MTVLDDFVAACRQAARSPRPQSAAAAVVQAALADAPTWAALRVPGADHRGVARLHRGDDVTVLHVELAPGFTSRIHNHGTWAVVGVLSGQEDNLLYRRQGEGVTAVGRQAVCAGSILRLGTDAIHAITNPLDRPLRALHVYGGDLESAWRHRWESEAGPAIPEGGAAAGR